MSNWKDEIDKNHEGQTGFFKQIEMENSNQMPLYVGTKRILAKPMTRGDYNKYRGWETPSDENPADTGYLVEYLDSPDSNHPDHSHYISWSPQDVFEKAYQLVPVIPTLGMQRVHANFNPSENDEIAIFKLKVAELIDFCEQKKNITPDGEAKRVFALAQTDLENAGMWGVNVPTLTGIITEFTLKLKVNSIMWVE
jgi:hypothetical protein